MYTKLLNNLEDLIRQREIYREQALYDLEIYKNIIVKKNRFCLMYMRDITSNLSDNSSEINRIHGILFNLITRCDNLIYDARGLD